MEKLAGSKGWTKLDSGIVRSTIWMESSDCLRVWIALLAESDSHGLVRASVPAMAHLCLLSVADFEEIIKKFCGPDPHSRCKEHNGRRLELIDGGWVILNYVKYRELTQNKARSGAERQRRYRLRLKEREAKVKGE